MPRDRLPSKRAKSELRALRPEDAAHVPAELGRPANRGEAATETARRDFALGSLVVDAGLRVSEACGLTCGDVELVEGVLHVRGQLAPLKPGEAPKIVPPKSDPGGYAPCRSCCGCRQRSKPCTRADDTAFVIRTRRGTPLSRHDARRSITQAGEEAKLGHVTPHTLRRSTGTALSEARVPEAAAVAIIGHSLEVFHGTYVKAHREALERDRARNALVELGLGVTPA